MKQKGLAPMLIVLLIAAALGMSGYVLYKQVKPTSLPQNSVVSSQTPQPTLIPSSTPELTNSTETVYTEASRSANWKTYELNHGIFKYPASIYIDKLVSNNQGVTIYNKDPRKNKEDVYYLSISEEQGKWERRIELGFISSNQATPANIGTLQVYKLEGLAKPGGISEETYVVDGKSTYIEIGIGNIPNDSKTNKDFMSFRNIVDQILSTFKFLP